MEVPFGAHSDTCTCQSFRYLPMAIEAERHEEVGIMRLAEYVMIFE
jgi:hypothetical protein